MGYKTFGAYSSTKGKKKGSPVLEDDAEAWRAHCRNVVAIVEGTVVGETAPQEPVMAGEVVRVEAEAESEPVGASEVVPEVMEREAPAKGPTRGSVEATGPVLTNETLRDWVRRWCGGDREGLPHISGWNTSGVTDMSYLFRNTEAFNSDKKHHHDKHHSERLKRIHGGLVFEGAALYYNPGAASFNDDISAWDTSNVITMCKMFHGASAFNQPLNDWRVDKVTNMSGMFQRASSFNQPLSGWRIDNVTNMSWMFHLASAFNRPLGRWQIREGCKTDHMFSATKFDGCTTDNMSKRIGPCCAIS